MTREAAIRLYLFYSEIYLHFVFKVIESSSAVPGWRKDLILEEEVKIPIVCNTFPSTASSPPGPPPHGWTGNYGGSSKCVILLLSSTDKAKLLHGSRDLHLPKALLRHGTHRSPPPPSPWRSSNQLSIISSTKQPLSSRTVYTLLACQYEINY